MSLSPNAANLLLKLPCGIPTRERAKAKDELLQAGLARLGTAMGVPALLLTDHGAAVRANIERNS